MTVSSSTVYQPAFAAPATGQIRMAGTATAVPGSYIVVLKAGKTGGDRIAGKLAFLKSGPPSGTPVVTVGSQELFGTEYEVEED